MHVKICGRRCYLWRAVDEDGITLEIFVSERRNKEAAESFFERLLGNYERPTKVTTDRLSSAFSSLLLAYSRSILLRNTNSSNCPLLWGHVNLFNIFSALKLPSFWPRLPRPVRDTGIYRSLALAARNNREQCRETHW